MGLLQLNTIGRMGPALAVVGLNRTSSNPLTYLFRDEFTTPRTVNNVNGTAAEPGVGNRTIEDTAHVVTIHDGLLDMTAGSSNFHDPHITEAVVTRAAGVTLFGKVLLAAANAQAVIGFTNGATCSVSYLNALNFGNGSILMQCMDGESISSNNDTYQTYASATWYDVAIMLRAAGAFYFIRYQNHWKLLRVTALGTTAGMYPIVTCFNNPIQTDKLLVAKLPQITPLVSDGFSSISASDGLGHPEGVTSSGLSGGAGVVGVAQKGTWQVSGGVASASALDGTLAAAIFTYPISTPNAVVSCTLTRAAGNVGIVLRQNTSVGLLDAVLFYHDGTRWLWKTYRAGSLNTLTQTGSVGIGAGKLKVSICQNDDGSHHVWFEANGASYSTQVYIYSGEVGCGLNVGLYTTDTGNTFDDFVAYPAGRQDEFASNLNPYAGLTQSYLATEKFIVFDGNSRVAGGEASTTRWVPTCMAALGSPYSCVNIGVGGRQGYQMLSEATSASPTWWYKAGRAKNITFYWEGYNDITAAYSAADCYQHFIDWATPLKAQGFQIVIATEIINGVMDAGKLAVRTAYNALIVTNSFGADAVVRLDSNAYIGDAGNASNTTYYNADKIHLVAAGQAIVSGLVVTAMQGLG